MKRIIVLFSLVSLVLLSNACKENSSVTTPASQGSNSFVQAMTGNLNQVPYQIFLYKAKKSILIPSADTTIKLVTDCDELNYAFLFDDAGIVKVNNNELKHASKGTYELFDPVFLLGTSNINISIEGSSNVPALNASVSNPRAFAEVLTPALGDRVNSSRDLEINWEPVSGSKMIVVIDISTNNPTTGKGSFNQYTTDDNGKFLISSSVLSQMQKGNAEITLRRGYANVLPNIGRGYAILAFTQHSLQFYLD